MLEIFDGHPAPPCHRILLALHHSSKRRFDLVSLIVAALGFLVEGVPVDKLTGQACGAMGRIRGIGAGRPGLLFAAAADRCKRPDRPAQ